MDATTRALRSHGNSSAAVHRMVPTVLDELAVGAGTLVDVGCGSGELWRWVSGRFDRYVGVDVVRYEGFPADGTHALADLDAGRVALGDEVADVAVCLETVEHVENPRALFRELFRMTRHGGLVLVSTPNTVSLASKLTLVLKDQFLAFQDGPGLYPAHITPLLPVDLRRIAVETGLERVGLRYSGSGRIPLTSTHWPHFLAARTGLRGKALSDNVLVFGFKASPTR